MLVVMWNLPGCMPEMEPVTFEEYSDAAEYLGDELDRIATGEYEYGSDGQRMYLWLAERVRLSVLRNRGGEYVSLPMPDGYVYSITRIE